MRATRTGPDAFTIEFESDEELREEHRTNLSMRGLRLEVPDVPPLHSAVSITLRGAGGQEAAVKATVVAPLPTGVALMFDGDPERLVEQLTVPTQPDPVAQTANGSERNQPLVERLREMPRVQKIIFAAKADRTERAFLLQDNDPQVLTSLLKNPRITIDEVIRVAKSSFLSYQVAELIMKTSQFMASVDVRIALIHNAKTPPPFALRLLPTLPDSEVRAIAKGGATSMQLKQAALKRLQGGK